MYDHPKMYSYFINTVQTQTTISFFHIRADRWAPRLRAPMVQHQLRRVERLTGQLIVSSTKYGVVRVSQQPYNHDMYLFNTVQRQGLIYTRKHSPL